MPRSARHTLTVVKIKSLLRSGGPKAVSDGAGLTLTTSRTGYATWILRYRFGGRRRELTIGSYQDFPLAKAREAAEAARRQIQDGIDPSSEKVARRDRVSDGPASFRDLAELWFLRRKAKQVIHPERIRRVLERWVYPVLGDLPLEDVTAGGVVACVEGVIEKGAPTTANDVRRHIKAVLKYGTILGNLQSNVAADIGQNDAGAPEKPRDTTLTLGEIRKLFSAMVKHRDTFGRDNELAVRLLLMLGIRKTELLFARWDEFDLDAGGWVIPAGRIKTRSHGKANFKVPLPLLAVDYLQELKVRACGSEWVFPARRRGRRKLGHVSPDTLNAALATLPVSFEKKFTVHDLRRTLRTQLSVLGARFEVAERCLNHKLPGIAGVYDRHDLLDTRRETLARWADVLRLLDKEGVSAAERLFQPRFDAEDQRGDLGGGNISPSSK